MNFDLAVWGERDPWRIINAAQKIEGKVDRLWLPETIDLDSVSILGAIAARTNTLKLGAGILNIYTRTIPLIAMTAATLQLISKNRFSLGIGVSTDNILEKHDVQMHQPLAQLRSAIQALRLAQTIDNKTTYKLPLQISFPIYVGTIGEKMSSLAGELADGLILNCATPEYAKKLMAMAFRGANEANRGLQEIEIEAALIFSLDLQRDRQSIVRRLAYYGSATSYNHMFNRSGFVTESEQLSKAWMRKDSQEAQRAISNEMIETLTATPENLSKITQRYASIGLTRMILVPVNFTGVADFLEKSTLPTFRD